MKETISRLRWLPLREKYKVARMHLPQGARSVRTAAYTRRGIGGRARCLDNVLKPTLRTVTCFVTLDGVSGTHLPDLAGSCCAAGRLQSRNATTLLGTPVV